ncbi:MAG: nucleotidyltransferase family protein, partial [Bacteroidales bacterium]|nr:nucleotidyltransferase family protein [Bacteroidales bacterium]
HRLFGKEGREMVAAAMEKAEVISAGGRSLLVLPPLTAFLGLVSHIGKHEIKGEFQLRLYIDIFLLLRKYGSEIICDRLPAAAAEAGIEKETWEVLTLMERVWGLTVPAEAGMVTETGDAVTLTDKSRGLTVPEEDGMAARIDDVSTPAALSLGSPVSAELSREQGRELVEAFLSKIRQPWSVPSLSQREFFLRNLRSFDSRWKRLIFIAGDLFPSVEFMKRRYGCRTGLKSLLFYPHRLGKLLWVLGLKRSGYQDD